MDRINDYIDTRGPWPVHIKGMIATELRPGVTMPESTIKAPVPQEIEYPE